MTRETKVGLIVGMGVILLIGIIVSDHLSVVQQQEPAMLSESLTRTTPEQPTRPGAITRDRQPQAARVAPPARKAKAQQPLPPPVLPFAGSSDPRPATENPTTVPPQLRPSPPATDWPPPAPRPRHDPVAQPRMAANRNPAPTVPSLRKTQLDPDQAASLAASPADQSQRRTSKPVSSRPRRVDAASTQVTAQPVVHYVRSGQTLWQIAQQYYDDGERWRVIAEANPQSVGADGAIRNGVRLVIPNKAGPSAEVLATGSSSKQTPVERFDRKGDQARSQGSPSGNRTIVVGSGDSLSTLAQEHLGSAKRWYDLYEANRDRLDSPDHLIAGTKLRMPEQRAADQKPTTARQAGSTPSKPSQKTYTVQPSDTLSSIAGKHLGDENRWREIYEANRRVLDRPDDIYVGQQLVLPKRGG